MDEKQFAEIEDYLNGAMSNEEKVRFEAQLASNEELASTFKLYQAIEDEMRSDIVRSSEETSLQSSLKTLTKKYFNTEPQKDEQQNGIHQHSALSNKADGSYETGMTDVTITGKEKNKVILFGTWKNLAVAAVLLGTVVISTIWFVQRSEKNSKEADTAEKTNTQKRITQPDTTSPVVNGSPNEVVNSDKNKNLQKPDKESTNVRLTPRAIDRKQLDALYSAYIKPDALPQPDQNAPEFDANESYSKGHYKEAITSFKESIERIEDPELRTRGEEDGRSRYLFYAYYYKAQSYIAVDSITKAIPDLRQALKNSPDEYWKGKVQWYLALTYLKKEQVQQAEALLKKVANNKNAGEYQQKSNQLVKGLKHTTKNN